MLQLNETLENGVIGLVISLVGTYFIAVWKGAESLDATRGAECLALENRVEELTPAKRTAEQQHHYAEAQAALSELGPIAIIVLRHLDAQEELVFKQHGVSPPLPTNMTAQDLRSWLDRCTDKLLVAKKDGLIPTGGVHPIWEIIYRIAPAKSAALKELLYAPPQ